MRSGRPIDTGCRFVEHDSGYAGGAGLGRPYPIPNLAKSWQISPDGKTYTFKLRDDVTFCSGKKLTADDVIYTFKRLQDPQTSSPQAWRAGKIKELRAPDPYTVEYELEEPYSGLLLQLTVFSNVIINQESVERLGKDYGVNSVDGTGPWCFVSWQPRNETVLRRHDAYHWGPAMYRNPGPVHFDRLVIRIVPEDSSRVAAMLAGTFDYSDHFPQAYIDQAMGAPMLRVEEAKPVFSLAYFGFRTTRDYDVRSAGQRGDEHRHQSGRDRQGCHAGPRRRVVHLRSPRCPRLRPEDRRYDQGRCRCREPTAR